MIVAEAAGAIVLYGLAAALVTIGGVGLLRTLILDVQAAPSQGAVAPIMNAALTIGLATTAFLAARALVSIARNACHG